MKKRFFLLFLIFLQVFCFSNTIRIGYLKGVNAIPFVNMMSKKDVFEFIEYKNIQSLVYSVNSGKIEAANVPINVALMLYSKEDSNIVCVATTQNLDFYLVSTNQEEGILTDFSINNLIEKKIAYSNSGLTNSFVKWYFEKNNIPFENTANGINLIDYKNEFKIVNDFINEKIDFAILSQVGLSSVIQKNKKTKILIDFEDAYSTIYGKSARLPINCVISNTDFANKQYDSLLIFAQNLENSINQINRNPFNAAKLANKNNLGLSYGISANAIKKGNYAFNTSKKSQQNIKNYVEIYNSYSLNVKVEFPDKEFFYY